MTKLCMNMKMMTKTNKTPVFEIFPRWETIRKFMLGKEMLTTIGVWVFDDKFRKIKREPFVGTTNKIIDLITKDIPNAEKGFRLNFSDERFDGCYPFPLTKMYESNGGCWYLFEIDSKRRLHGWLCKVVYSYFQTAPDTIWFKASEK